MKWWVSNASVSIQRKPNQNEESTKTVCSGGSHTK